MSTDGYYYLHTNGDLIYKKYRPEVEHGGFVLKVWGLDASDRGVGWIICIEALALGARRSRIDELAKKWGLTDEDAQEFAARAGLKVFNDGDQWCAAFDDFVDTAESQCGFGPTALDALSKLAEGGLLEKRV